MGKIVWGERDVSYFLVGLVISREVLNIYMKKLFWMYSIVEYLYEFSFSWGCNFIRDFIRDF